MAWDYLPVKNAKQFEKENDFISQYVRQKSNKYKNEKIECDGIVFDSKKELNRYQELQLLLKAGEIRDLQLQVKYILIPTQREVFKDEDGNLKARKVIERECSYVADFVYIDKKGDTVVEDTKGFRTEVYKIKKKLMLQVHKIEIKEI